MKKKLLAVGLLAVLMFTLCSCEFKMPKIKKKIPEITTVTLSETDVGFLNSKYQNTAVEVQNSLNENTATINEVYKLVNKYRQDMDKEILTFDSSLSVIATIRAQEIAK